MYQASSPSFNPVPKCPRPLHTGTSATSCTLCIMRPFSTRTLSWESAQQRYPVVRPSPGQSKKKTPPRRRSLFPVSKSISYESPFHHHNDRLITTLIACQLPNEVPPSDHKFSIWQSLHPKLLLLHVLAPAAFTYALSPPPPLRCGMLVY